MAPFKITQLPTVVLFIKLPLFTHEVNLTCFGNGFKPGNITSIIRLMNSKILINIKRIINMNINMKIYRKKKSSRIYSPFHNQL